MSARENAQGLLSSTLQVFRAIDAVANVKGAGIAGGRIEIRLEGDAAGWGLVELLLDADAMEEGDDRSLDFETTYDVQTQDLSARTIRISHRHPGGKAALVYVSPPIVGAADLILHNPPERALERRLLDRAGAAGRKD